MDGNRDPAKPKLFISHKHVDGKIADVIRSFITMSSGGHVAVHQSSSPLADAPKVGRNLNKQLRQALWKSSVVILVYTAPDQDWNYCMFECGVASHPQSPDTKIVVFQCTGSVPALFAEQVNVNVRNLVDIQKFTDEFLTGPDFFPERTEPITQFAPHGPEVAAAAADFHQKLQPVLPPEKEDPLVEWPAYPFLQFELPLPLVDNIQKAEAEERLSIAGEVILNNCVVSSSDRFGEQLFGVPSFPRGTSLRQLAGIWKERYPQSTSQWVDSLRGQILDAAMWRFPRGSWALMQGLGDGSWYAPVLNRVRKIPGSQVMQFNVYFYRFEVCEDGSVRLNAPAT